MIDPRRQVIKKMLRKKKGNNMIVIGFICVVLVALWLWLP